MAASNFAHLFNVLLLLSSSSFLVADSQRLHRIEASALRRIAKKLNKANWDFSVDPCTAAAATGEGNWTVPDPDKGFESTVVCDCSFFASIDNSNTSVCHITGLYIKGENLIGRLPMELSRLEYLQQLDLSRNFINGTIPADWSTLPLVGLSVSR